MTQKILSKKRYIFFTLLICPTFLVENVITYRVQLLILLYELPKDQQFSLQIVSCKQTRQMMPKVRTSNSNKKILSASVWYSHAPTEQNKNYTIFDSMNGYAKIHTCGVIFHFYLKSISMNNPLRSIHFCL